jgi:murein hydrolase activator
MRDGPPTNGPSRCPACLLLTVLLSLLAAAYGSALADELDVHRDRLDRLRSDIGRLTEAIASKSDEKAGLARLLRETDELVAAVSGRLRGLEARLGTQTRLLGELRVEKTGLAETLQKQREALGRQIRAAYVMGRQEQIKILLNQQDPATVSRMMTYYDYVGRARAARMAEIREQLGLIDAAAARIAAEESELEKLFASQARELSTLADSQQARRDLLARIDGELTDQGHRLSRMQADERELGALLARLEQAGVDQAMDNPAPTPFGERCGRLRWPAAGSVVHRYGTPRLGSLVWDGVMIAAPEGDEVRAVHHGRVAYADWLRGFGLLLIIDHGDGYLTLYGHNQTLFKEVGDWVDEGEAVALVGASGGRQRPAVYFGIRYQGRSVNPTRWLGRLDAGGMG